MNVVPGDFVYCTGSSSFCDSSNEKVLRVTIKYDENSGCPYNVIHLDGDRMFDSRNGNALNPPLAYFICPTEQEAARAEQEIIDEEEMKSNILYQKRQDAKQVILDKLTQEERDILGV